LGYRNTHVFCGKMPVEGAVILESHCELVFEASDRGAKSFVSPR
jgi:hypothetical protein